MLRVGLALGLALASVGARAQPPGTAPADGAQRPPIRFSVSATPVHQFESELDDGGRYQASHFFLRAEATMPVNRKLLLGLGASLEYSDYEFSGTPAFAGTVPWRDVQRVGFSVPFRYLASERWVYFIEPSVQWARENGADWSESLIYGATFAAIRAFSPRLKIGPGVAAFERLEESSIFPFIVVDWRINERLRLGNALPTGPAGAGGFELAYARDPRWEFAGGLASRSFRFRLRDDGPVPGGVGETSSVPVFARVSYRSGRQLRLDFYAGVAFKGKLRLEDADGNRVAGDDHDAAPITALTVSGRF